VNVSFIRRRMSSAAIVFTLAGGLLLPCGSATAGEAGVDKDAGVWARQIWAAASRGDFGAVEAYFARPPVDDLPMGLSEAFSASYEQFVQHRRDADAARAQRRDVARNEMGEKLNDDDIAGALRSAVTIQTLSDDLNAAFDDADIMAVVARAEHALKAMDREQNWMQAQELLYLLRTFHDDTERVDAFRRIDDQLELMNQRVGLLARYAPRLLHDKRSQRLRELGEADPGEFNPLRAIDWRERVADVDQRMVIEALRQAASEHIETRGWRPLLEGGLDAIRILVTTPQISETFASLGDAARVNEMVRYIDAQRADLDRLSDGAINRRTCSRIINDLAEWNQRTVDLPIPVLLREFGDGAMGRLDIYSDVIWPDGLRRFQQQTQGNFVGIGVLIRYTDMREVEVVNPLEGTPAYSAGVKPGDVIMTVDGDSTAGWTLNDAVDRITGRRGTVVRLGVRREGQDELLTIPITRDVIKIRSVKGWEKVGVQDDGEPVWNWFIEPGSRIAYLRLTQFTDSSLDEIMQAWGEMLAGGHRPSGLVLDLRHNPGGLLTTAVRVSNLFIRRGDIVSGEDRDQKSVWIHQALPSFSVWAEQSMPTVVLVNKGSASASEIVAGALQAHRRAIVVGERTYGKGSVQTVHTITPQARLKLTTQYYRLPSPDGGITPGRLVHRRPGATEWGVDPDIEVPMSVDLTRSALTLRQEAEIFEVPEGAEPGTPMRARADIHELLTRGLDPQLQTALLILKSQVMAMDDVRHARRD